jgi:LysM repeat protein
MVKGSVHAMKQNDCLDPKRRTSNILMYRSIILAGMLMGLSLSACARLGPTIEPDKTGSEVTMDSLKSAVRDEQRMATDLRLELSDRRKELADVHVARAQLQGMLRETERRLAEARHIIELQREELEAAREDRERVETTGRQLQGRLRRLEKLLALARRHGQTGEVIPSGYVPQQRAPLAGSTVVSRQVVAVDMNAPETMPAAMDGVEGANEARRVVIVRKGETLWRLARRYQVDLDELRQLNGLQDNHIVTGWALRLPDSVQAAELQNAGARRLMR